jgi:Leucine-rich repeat (LRR) protein
MLHLSALTRLEVLDVSQCTGVVTDAVLAAILPAMSRLRELNLSQNKEITFEGLRHLPPSLTTLDVVFCKKLSPRALDFLPPTLRNLNLSYCFFFKNRGDVSLAFPPALRRLNLSGCELLSDGALRDVAAAVPHLRHLNLTECYRLTDVGTRALTLPALEST